MTTDSDRVQEKLLDLAWSLWTGLGLPGQIDNHFDHGIDPEALVVFTVGLGDADPRLRNEAVDWCIRYGGLLSGARLKNLVAKADDGVRARFGEFAATVAAHSPHRWSGMTEARPYSPRERPSIGAFTRQSQMVLRLRAWAGIGVRAEIIRAFFTKADTAFGASDLADETGYSKRSVAQVLDTLCLGDALQAFPVRNQIHYRMPQQTVERLRELLAPAPVFFVRWPFVVRVLRTAFEAVSLFESKKEAARAVEARSVVEKLASEIHAAWLPAPNRDVHGAGFWGQFVSWLSAVADNLAAGNEPAGDRFKSRWSDLAAPHKGEAMERGDFAVWRSPLGEGSLPWALGFCKKGRPREELDQGVRYPTIEDAKRTAEVRQLTLDKGRFGGDGLL